MVTRGSRSFYLLCRRKNGTANGSTVTEQTTSANIGIAIGSAPELESLDLFRCWRYLKKLVRRSGDENDDDAIEMKLSKLEQILQLVPCAERDLRREKTTTSRSCASRWYLQSNQRVSCSGWWLESATWG